MRVPNAHLEPRFPRRRTQIAMGEVLERRALRGEGVCKEGNCLGERGSLAVLETVVTGLTGIENRSDRYLLTDSENRSPEGFVLHERFENLWEKRCSILRIGQVSKRGVFRELLEIFLKRFLLHLSTFVVKTRIESL
jgi:hypothetical protein